MNVDFAQAAAWYSQSAGQGYAVAQFSLGLCYAHGKGVPQDYSEARAWYRKAADQNNPDALVNLALFYLEGIGVDKDEKMGMEYIRKAAEAGAVDAQFELGVDYTMGFHGMEKNQQLSAEWFRKAAEQGMVMAQYDLVMAEHGDPKEVYFWLTLAIPHLEGDTLKNATAIREEAASHLSATQQAEIETRAKQWQAGHSQAE